MKKILKYAFLVTVTLLAFVLLINSDWFDEDLLPEVQAIKNIQAEPYKAGNGYIGILALNSATGPSFSEASERIREFLNNKIKQTGLDYLSDKENAEVIGLGHDKNWLQDLPSCNGRKQLGCFEDWVTHVKQMNWDDVRLKQQFLRYQALLNSTHFEEPKLFDWNSPFIAYRPVLSLSKIHLAMAASLSSDAYLQVITKDAEYWQKMLDQSNYLISQMVAIAALHHHIHALSNAIMGGDLTDEQLLALQSSIHTPPSNASIMKRVFEYEFKYGMGMMDEMEKEKSFFDRIDLYQPQATHNHNYTSVTKRLNDLIYLDPKAYADKHVTKSKSQSETPSIWAMHMLYNPTGKQLIGYALPAYTDYISRYHDLNIKWVLLKAQIDIALHPEQPIDQTLAESKYQNPITGQAFDYNPKDGTIGFDCLERIESNCRLQVH